MAGHDTTKTTEISTVFKRTIAEPLDKWTDLSDLGELSTEIPSAIRYVGMLVYVLGEQEFYFFKGGILDENFVAFSTELEGIRTYDTIVNTVSGNFTEINHGLGTYNISVNLRSGDEFLLSGWKLGKTDGTEKENYIHFSTDVNMNGIGVFIIGKDLSAIQPNHPNLDSELSDIQLKLNTTNVDLDSLQSIGDVLILLKDIQDEHAANLEILNNSSGDNDSDNVDSVVDIDTSLSTTSTNALENRVISAELSNKIGEAPTDNKQYARKNSTWVEVGDVAVIDSELSTTSTNALENKTISAELSNKIGEAPVDGNSYTRKDSTWVEVEEVVVDSTLSTTSTNALENKTISAELSNKIGEAPVDGNSYTRKDSTWVEVEEVDESRVPLINDYSVGLNSESLTQVLLADNVLVEFTNGIVRLSGETGSDVISLINKPESEIVQLRFENPVSGESGYLNIINNDFFDPSSGEDYLFISGGGTSSTSPSSSEPIQYFFSDINGVQITDPNTTLPSGGEDTVDMYTTISSLYTPQTQEEINTILVNKNYINESKPQILSIGSGVGLDEDGDISLGSPLTRRTLLEYVNGENDENTTSIDISEDSVIIKNNETAEVSLSDSGILLKSDNILMPDTSITNILDDSSKKQTIHREFLEYSLELSDTWGSGTTTTETIDGVTLEIVSYTSSLGKKVLLDVKIYGVYTISSDGFIDFTPLTSSLIPQVDVIHSLSNYYGDVHQPIIINTVSGNVRIYVRANKDFGSSTPDIMNGQIIYLK